MQLCGWKPGALCALAVIAACAWAAPVLAQEQPEIFDAHLHYNQEPSPFYPLPTVLEMFRRNNVTGILATSRPNKGTHELVAAKAPGLTVVPFIRPYRVRADIQTWFNDETIWTLIQEEFRRGYYRGIGEFHIYGKAPQSGLVKRIVDFAVAQDFWLHAHCDEEALLILLGHNPRAKIIWAHTGFTTAPERVRELLEKYPRVMGELSYRSGITEGSGKLAPEWRELFGRHSARFLLGSDTWIGQRWAGYDTIMKDYRGWLAQLPADQAQRIANGNARRLFARTAN
jgi:hypothetical protein